MNLIKFSNFSRSFLILNFLLLIFVVYSTSDELNNTSEPESGSSDGHLVDKSNSPQLDSTLNETSTSSAVVNVFKRSFQNCITRRFGNIYRRICTKGHRGIDNNPTLENKISNPEDSGNSNPENSPFDYGFNYFPLPHRRRNRNRFRNPWNHNYQNYPKRHHRPRWHPRPSPKPAPPPIHELSSAQPNREYCGMRSYDPLGGRVVGGRPAEAKEFPWQVGIQESDGDGDYFIRGGGVIVDKRWILTAAHVFVSNPKIEDYRGVIGAVDLKGNGKSIKFDKLIKHDKYADTPDDYQNDIALLHTTEDIPLYPAADNMNNICLPNPDEEFRGSVTVSGWGKTHEQGSDTNILMTVDLQVFEPEVCEKNYKNYFRRKIMICAGYAKGGKDSCSGDSGGPLIKRRKHDNRWYLTGIVSFGGYQKCARKGSGASYTKVSKYIPWIMNHMKQ